MICLVKNIFGKKEYKGNKNKTKKKRELLTKRILDQSASYEKIQITLTKQYKEIH